MSTINRLLWAQVPKALGKVGQSFGYVCLVVGILSGFDNALHELKSYREGKLELKPLEDVLNEL